MKKSCTSLLRTALLPCLLFFCGLASSVPTRGETNPRFYAVEVSATVQTVPAQVTLKWTADSNASGYSIYRKTPSGTSWNFVTSLGGTAATWTDGNVASGNSYEYAVTKSTSVGYQGTGYVLAGINAPMTENRGKMILIVDNTHAAALAAELTRLQQDLVGDGWTVIRHDVARTASAPTVKNLIKNEYNADPSNVKSVFLFGHVAVPYSGNFNPDGHPDHQGAWTADTYYGDMDGNWTDSSVNNSGAEKPWNRNTPGDGKFDQSDLPSDVELAVGRVDLYNMTCYSNKAWSRSELDLLRAYLNKDNNFRHGRISVPRRGLVCDNFGEMQGEAFASTGWRSFAPFFGAENNAQVPYGQYFSTLRDNGYLWSYGTGGGSWYTCNGVGSSDDFANTEVKTVFTAFLGSYFGDWDNESAFLRAPLGSGWALATAWGGRPHWFFHPMGLGETIGTAAKLSQNNRYGGLYNGQNWGTRQVHVTLLGDPSLRMHPVIPPANVAAAAGAGVTITWAPSTDSAIQGYAVYRSGSANGPFTKVSGSSLVPSLFFTDPSGTAGNFYMVRAVKLEQSGSGTYLNPSQGILAGTGASPSPTPTPTPTAAAPAAPSNLSGSALSSTQARIQWNDNSSDESGFRVLRKVGASGAYSSVNVGANSVAYTDSGLSGGTQYFYKVQAYNTVGNSPDSAEISVITPNVAAPSGSTATFLANDSSTQGSWRATYGTEGYAIPAYATSLPSALTANVVAGKGQPWTWQYSTSDARAVERVEAGAGRLASCWYAADTLEFAVKAADGLSHKLALYCFDFDRAGRQQTVEIVNQDNGQVLDSRPVSDFGNGVWLTYSVSGNIAVRVKRLAGPNCVISGLFFQASGASSTPVVTPTPVTGSASAAVRNLGINTATSGSWKGAFGSAGFQVAGDITSAPANATVSFKGKTDHVWNWSTADAAALQRAGTSDRVAACWYSGSSFDVSVAVAPNETVKVSFYSLDWDLANRSQRVEVLDAATGAVLNTTTLSSFQKGAYLSFDVKGNVIFRFTRTGPYNAVVGGIFFDAPSSKL